MSGDNAEVARKGLLHSAAGKAKEVAGALLNNDSLTKEGQLQRAEAQAQKQAGVTDAVAEARGEHAVEELEQAHGQARDDRQAAARQAGVQERAAEQDRRRERASADELADRRREAGELAAQRRTSGEIEDAVSDTQGEIVDADQGEAQALERRRRAEQVAEVEEQAARRARAAASELDPASGEEQGR